MGGEPTRVSHGLLAMAAVPAVSRRVTKGKGANASPFADAPLDARHIRHHPMRLHGGWQPHASQQKQQRDDGDGSGSQPGAVFHARTLEHRNGCIIPLIINLMEIAAAVRKHRPALGDAPLDGYVSVWFYPALISTIPFTYPTLALAMLSNWLRICGSNEMCVQRPYSWMSWSNSRPLSRIAQHTS